MTNTKDPLPPLSREMFAREAPGDCSKADISNLRRLVQPAAQDEPDGRAEMESGAPLDQDVLQAIVSELTNKRPTKRASTYLTDEQELAVRAYGIVTDQAQSAVIRLAVARFMQSDEFRAVIKRT